MADGIDYSRAEKGRRESHEGIVQQLAYIVKMYGEPGMDEALRRRGFGAARFERAVALLALLDTQDARRAGARDSTRLALAEEVKARTELKAIKRDLDSSLVDVFADHETPGVTPDAFAAGTRLGQSTPKISGYFAKILEPLQTVSSLLAEYNDGRDLYAEAVAAKKRLDEAQATQEVGVRQLPEETVKILALKGEALDLIEKFNRAGKRAFQGNAATIGRFNKDLILRARSGGGVDADEPVAPTGT